MTGSDEFSEPDNNNTCIKKSNISNIIQLDGNVSGSVFTNDDTTSYDDEKDNTNQTTYETEDEAHDEAIPANFSPIPGQKPALHQDPLLRTYCSGGHDYISNS